MRKLKKGNWLKKVFLASIALFLVGLLIFKNQKLNYYLNPSIDNEDANSQYSVPKDVENAVNESKNTRLPVLGIRADGPSYKIPILMYHYVEYVKDKGDKIRISLDTPPVTLDSEIKTLKDAGYTFINASDLADILDGIKNPPDKPIMLTFDDGYRDFYTDAYPILKKYNAKAVQYVITGFLNRNNYLTTAQLSEISKSGLVEIGAHTVHHLALSGMKGDTVLAEMTNSKVQLETMLGISVTAFAYPYGSFDLNAIQIAKSVGFRTALSTVPGTEVGNYNRFFVNRLRPGGLTGKSLLNLITSK